MTADKLIIWKKLIVSQKSPYHPYRVFGKNCVFSQSPATPIPRLHIAAARDFRIYQTNESVPTRVRRKILKIRGKKYFFLFKHPLVAFKLVLYNNSDTFKQIIAFIIVNKTFFTTYIFFCVCVRAFICVNGRIER